MGPLILIFTTSLKDKFKYIVCDKILTLECTHLRYKIKLL
jgi:hypothetical protein